MYWRPATIRQLRVADHLKKSLAKVALSVEIDRKYTLPHSGEANGKNLAKRGLSDAALVL